MTNPATPLFITSTDLDQTTLKIANNKLKVDTAGISDGATISVDANGKLTSNAKVVDTITGHKIGTFDSGAGTTAINETITTISNVVVGNRIATYTNENAVGISINETVTSVTASGKHYVFRAEDGATSNIDPATFISADAPNTLKVGTDGGLLVPTATDTTAGIASLAVESNYPSTSDTEATTPAFVNKAVALAIGGIPAVPVANDTTQGITSLAVAANYPSSSDTEATTPAFVNAAVGNSGKVSQGTNVTVTGTGTTADPHVINVATATDTVKGVSSLAVAANYPSVSDVEAATPAFVNASAAATLATAQTPASRTVAGITKLATAADYPSTSATISTTPEYVKSAIDTLVPAASDTVQGKVALNLGTSMPADASNSTDALTAFGFNAIANDTSIVTPNPTQQAIMNAVQYSVSTDPGAQTALAAAITDDIVAIMPAAADTVQGKVALNLGTNLPTDANNSVDALTSVGLSNLLNDVSTPGGNAVQINLRNFLPTATTAAKGMVTLAVAADYPEASNDVEAVTPAYVAAAISAIPVIPDATDITKGKVSLAVAANFPSNSDIEATTPAYLSAAISGAISGAVVPATDTTAGVVSLAVAANYPSSSDTEATTPAFVNAAIAAAVPNLAVKDEGALLTPAMTSINFVGSGLKATNTAGAVTLTAKGTANVSATTPTSPVKDELWYDEGTTGRTFVWTGTQWVDIAPQSILVLEDAFE